MDKILSFLKKKFKQPILQTVFLSPFSKNTVLNLFFNVILAWFVFGLFIVRDPMEAIVTRMGKYHRTAKPGIHWHMLFVEHITKVQVGPLKFYVNPVTILTKDGALISANSHVTYKIYDAYQLLFGIQNSKEYLQKMSLLYFVKIVSQHTLQELMLKETAHTIQKKMQLSLEALFNHHVLQVKDITVGLPTLQLPAELAPNLKAIEIAEQKANTLIENAHTSARYSTQQLAKNSLELYQTARAQKEKIIIDAQSEAKEFITLLPHYLRSPHTTIERLYARTIDTLLKNTAKVIVNANGLHTMSTLLESDLKNITTSEKE